MDVFEKLNEWYQSNCDGDWEHCFGVNIETLDNPGWIVKIDLYYTELKDKPFEEIEINNGDDDWLFCKVENGKFQGAGDPNKLKKIIEIFVEWQEQCAEENFE